jgi:hypothetical protein
MGMKYMFAWSDRMTRSADLANFSVLLESRAEVVGKTIFIGRLPIGSGAVSESWSYTPEDVLSPQHLGAHLEQPKVEDGLREDAVDAGDELARQCLKFLLETLG